MSEQGSLEHLGIPSDCDGKIAEAVRYWLSIKPEDGLPGRQHIDPTDIPSLLHGVWLIDVRRNPLSFVFRLVGTSVVNFFGKDPTGRSLYDVFQNFEETIAYKDFCHVVETGELRWRRGAPVLSHLPKFSGLERVYLPFARDGKDVDMIFCFSVFRSAKSSTNDS
jgi:PAS domain